jgi:hypothetical protein
MDRLSSGAVHTLERLFAPLRTAGSWRRLKTEAWAYIFIAQRLVVTVVLQSRLARQFGSTQLSALLGC